MFLLPSFPTFYQQLDQKITHWNTLFYLYISNNYELKIKKSKIVP